MLTTSTPLHFFWSHPDVVCIASLWTEQVAQFYEKLSEQPQAMVVAFEAAQLTQIKKKGEAQRTY